MIERVTVGFLIEPHPPIEPTRVWTVVRVRRIKVQVLRSENALAEHQFEPLRAEAAGIEISRGKESRDAGSGDWRGQIIEFEPLRVPPIGGPGHQRVVL